MSADIRGRIGNGCPRAPPSLPGGARGPPLQNRVLFATEVRVNRVDMYVGGSPRLAMTESLRTHDSISAKGHRVQGP